MALIESSQDGTRVVIHPVDKPQAEPIRVAYDRVANDRVKHCSKLFADKFWLTRAIAEVKTTRRCPPIMAIQIVMKLIAGTK